MGEPVKLIGTIIEAAYWQTVYDFQDPYFLHRFWALTLMGVHAAFGPLLGWIVGLVAGVLDPKTRSVRRSARIRIVMEFLGFSPGE